MSMQAKFQDVKGYATYENAQKRGEEVAATYSAYDFRWVVIALPTGRYVPMIIINSTIQGGPGPFLGLANVCLCN